MASGHVNGDPKNDPFYGAGSIVFDVLRQLYIAAIVCIFLISMGNRPQGSKWIYVTCAFIFALIMGVILYLSGFTIYLVIRDTSSAFSSASGFASALFNKSAFRDLVVSLASTYGMYLIASLLYFEPWHMFTSMVQYIFLLPSFVNILGVYSCKLKTSRKYLGVSSLGY